MPLGVPRPILVHRVGANILGWNAIILKILQWSVAHAQILKALLKYGIGRGSVMEHLPRQIAAEIVRPSKVATDGYDPQFRYILKTHAHLYRVSKMSSILCVIFVNSYNTVL
uniref:Uncharacterized protein n=1 Tax=Pseudo-nitzschia australis TaxID=44445 RepID=A0A6U9ZGJ3_9STRA|mmetsp:Transcript_21937/g.46147  ORF Transcript_21937/g.46147 Transcript_21937/m.46147 type:complete len:112 (-) Transcript_21937:2775-3110(-)